MPFGWVCFVVLTSTYSSIFTLMLFDWVCSIMLTPAYSSISHGNIIFLFTCFLFMATFSGTILEHKTRAWYILLCHLLVLSSHLMRFDVVTWVKV